MLKVDGVEEARRIRVCGQRERNRDHVKAARHKIRARNIPTTLRRAKQLTSLPCGAAAESPAAPAAAPAPAPAASVDAVAPEGLGEFTDISESSSPGAGAVSGTAFASGGAAAASYVSSAQFPVGCDREAISTAHRGQGQRTTEAVAANVLIWGVREFRF